MTSFSSLLSSLGDKGQAPVPVTRITPQTTQPDPRPSTPVDRFKLTPNNAAAGVKRRSDDLDDVPKPKNIKTEQNAIPARPSAPSNRFQLTAKPTAPRASSSAPTKTMTATSRPVNQLRTAPGPGPLTKPGASEIAARPSTAEGATKKKSFLSILEKAKAAQVAAAATSAGGIKHKPVERLTKKERIRLREEAMAQHKPGKKPQLGERSRSGTPNTANGAILAKKAQLPEMMYKGTMKKASTVEPLNYKGTMKPAGSVPKSAPKKGLPQDKYGGYASWSDLNDEDEDEDEEEGYDESDDDMEGGFDDVEAEEQAALAAAKREDQAALAEEARLKREKEERKRKLLALSKSAAAKKKF
ncbi:hypothetical protein LTR53_006159 [Teratosphaeriaceae sp. CCFEE 6253]|nr:hypothetical protein LTR53_006159 [Teratosphaeriaceae sp. CCFEE 6253]